MNLDKSLRLALIVLMENKITVVSWGISNIIINTTSLHFDVYGMKYKGNVFIEVSGDTKYTIKIGDKLYQDVGIDNMVMILDNEIECTKEYLEDLRKWLAEKGIK